MQKIRLILNQNCQYNCIFCHKENVPYHNKENFLNAQDYAFFAQTAKELGFSHFALTGGEPLLRDDIIDIIDTIYLTKSKIQITTNGILLNKLNNINNLDHINISLHSLNEINYQYITNSNYNPSIIINNLKEFKKVNNTPIKLNLLALRNITFNDDNVKAIISLCKELKITLKIIELLNYKSSLYVSYNDIKSYIQKLGYNVIDEYRGGQIFQNDCSKIIIQKCLCNYIKEKDSSDLYCKKYNDLFLTCDGQINYCRYKPSIDIYDVIKSRNKSQLQILIEKSSSKLKKCPLK